MSWVLGECVVNMAGIVVISLTSFHQHDSHSPSLPPSHAHPSLVTLSLPHASYSPCLTLPASRLILSLPHATYSPCLTPHTLPASRPILSLHTLPPYHLNPTHSPSIPPQSLTISLPHASCSNS
ncbi:hypothetical protein Pmani_035264 [Petrolisthes manimaculis]|uniref:Uncharacterized protein n=1 Tax=Petrolisthes manimaculis TaxID=1843537 RepID=A0AAE1TNL7_9EUCA|nr:hypothetical protein Pmani_035264 [Petrolisthes manimaculis]